MVRSLKSSSRVMGLCGALLLNGCLSNAPRLPSKPHDTRESYYRPVQLDIEYPDVTTCPSPEGSAAQAATLPLSLEDPSQIPAWDLTLPQAIEIAMGHSPVLRNLGGSVVNTAANGTRTVFDPASTYADPQLGVEAALSAFDAQYSGQLFWNKNDQPINQIFNPIIAQFQPNVFQQTTATYISEVSKTTASGANFALRHQVVYDRNNRPSRQFSSDYVGFLEAQYRQPLLQGAGVEFNRIAGPNGAPGQYRGVLIARINTDIALADFEASVIQLVADVEQSYWNLYYAYRNLDSILRGREAALQTFQFQEVRLRVGAGRSDEEAQAESQFFQFQSQLENALAGQQGLYALEQNLRYLLGLPASDGRLIRPASDPQTIKVTFDWEDALTQSLTRRVEIRRQQWQVKRRELELFAARLNRRPRLDYVGLYRWRGLGDDLIGDRGTVPGTILDENLYASITGGQYQEWQSGIELTFPIGLRQASVAISSAQLLLARDRAILNETELRVSHDLSQSSREVSRSLQQMQTNLNRWNADLRQVEVLRQRYRNGADNINFLLQAQRQVVLSQSDYYRSVVDYNLALRDFHRQKGSLLAYNQVYLTEGPWSAGALRDAYQRGRFLTPRLYPEAITVPRPVAAGEFNPSERVNTNPIPE